MDHHLSLADRMERIRRLNERAAELTQSAPVFPNAPTTSRPTIS